MPTVSGYAAVFGDQTVIAGQFRERLARGCFAKSLRENDIRCLLDHDTGRVLGRTKAGTLKLREDRIGLYFSVEIDETTPEGQTVRGAVGRQDLSGCSFGFRVRAEEWEDGGNRLPLRTLTDIDLHEVTICAFPAYPTTTAVLNRSETNAVSASRRRAEAAMRRRGIPLK